MAMYEYVLRHPGRPDEQLITDVDSVGVGDEIEIRNRTWIVVAVEPASEARFAERKILEPRDAEQA
jgi:hypothetical protein